MNISENSTITHSASVIAAELEDTVVLMNVDTGDYYDIDPIGSVVWAKIEQPRKIADVCEELCDEFDVTPKQCQTSVLKFITEMHNLGAIKTG